MTPKHSIVEVFTEENATGVAYKNKALKRALINHLDQSGNATISDLSNELNISAPKTTSLVNELIQDGLIRDYGKIDSTGGRRASMYGLVAESCFFIGVDVKRYYINIGLLDFKKNLVTVNIKVPFLLENTQASLNQLIELIRNFINDLPDTQKPVLAICVNLSGRINTTSGYSYSFFHFNEEPLTTTLENALGIRTFLENDSRAMAYGEFHSGVVSNEKNVLFVNLDYGIGLGILIDGKVYYGKSGFGGEFGHIPLFHNELICQCGKKGCLETEASGQALIRLFREKIEQGSTSSIMSAGMKAEDLRLSDIIQSTRNEDVLSIELVANLGEKIGRGLAVLINIFNPELVVLGGTLAETGDYIRLPIRSALNKYSLSLVNNDTQLHLSRLGEKSGVIGGCLIARSKLLSSQ
ncbi:ROK family transcriptional regulator [Flavihumibacter solisilvae]|uniref:ROK family transcriptional regulator n=1 Tax=Flavihumibacter solisilvae TaxID=1349421 RepID=UPI000691288F|nr:ROK family transcriptional regulator [Flavihumibacter solisilvae]